MIPCRLAGGRMKPRVLILLSASMAGGLQAGGIAPAGEWPIQVTELTTPASTNSGQPQLSVAGDHVVLSWIERAGENAALRFSERTGTGWSEARTVASASNWFVNWADVPSVVRLQDG